MEQQNSPTWFLPDYPPLNSKDDVAQAAVNGQVVQYPMIARRHVDPPITGQRYGNLSYMLFNTPKLLRDGKHLYGFVKQRGNHESEHVARTDAHRIVRNVDSKFQVRIAEVGVWVPITESDLAVKDLYDVRESDQEIHLRDEAIKEKEREHARKIKELQEAEKELKEGGDRYDNQESIEFYTMKRVVEITLTETYKASLLKLKEYEKKLAEQRIILKTLESNHKTYKDDWISTYNEGRAKSGLSKFIPGETQFADYESVTLEELLEKYPSKEKSSTLSTTSGEQVTGDISLKSKRV